jgi:putative acetyltransferase
MVAEKAAQVVGVVGLMVGTGRVRHSGSLFVYVVRQYQGQGIGTRLVQTLLDLADQWLLLQRVELTVLTENEGAKHLYERFGFVVEGCRKMSVPRDAQRATSKQTELKSLKEKREEDK